MKLFDDVLGERIELLKRFLDENIVVNVPNYSVQSMIAGKNRNTFIVEPGRKNLDIKSFDRDFMVLTNFSLSENLDKDYTEVKGHGNDRYKKAYEMIVKNKETFNKNIGFSLLKETIQSDGDYPTQLSMIFIPEESVVYFAISGNFNKIFEFSFLDQQIRTNTGFTKQKSYPLSKKGILLSELETW